MLIIIELPRERLLEVDFANETNDSIPAREIKF